MNFVATVVSSVDPLSPSGLAASAVASSGHMTAPTISYPPEHPHHPAACFVPPLPAGIDPADFQAASKANSITTNGLLAVESILLSSSHVYGHGHQQQQQQLHQEDMLASMAAAAAAAGINVDLGQQLASAAAMDQHHHHHAGKVMGGDGGGGGGGGGGGCGPQSPKYISL